ncbi:hypothetical protein K0P33_26310 [Pseudomonas sp. ArH3a]|uniref:hypothetical protein n=1 Tax=Pseudomonas TaxID=286 RepID=UPI001140C2E6|nr:MULTISPECIES: hypothetical protein [unclassified Pseudomonas]MCV2226690.1 hypothetical protein [Pseudomonas sp. AU10]UNM18989.1 hypothetical protein K0P33_26310 [Pseudomonas sp. ArH3a]
MQSPSTWPGVVMASWSRCAVMLDSDKTMLNGHDDDGAARKPFWKDSPHGISYLSESKYEE